ncbi:MULTISPECIES: hypothetical protein [unclassified Bradyrhizobium]|uniref:hypothetical protein n=1 Tax=unclassified Bradyrhizobium TaxID=2631580 RepID=UPI001BA45D8F|nr:MULTISPECIES: hypothetical protein [unclassified Bradyrhizobium]WLA52391.1 hypothetical protein QIH80_21225 [Bradyrhizobium elkanii]MBR1206945.1 hypothetical protein [Bradyrhizobium sp. AUGA SZCCT0124]MBR1313484.1 hypothetical protein [Bradyrhizobium sp. AUGA SZCCT0051]MBR1343419.1 hypothetical protein [Bradyrhizobium sp. AUGA SZCCT0105]MBR1357161.1 hypothetical protein [Bradyrhizobium sp. AUGA SZCCT0045]
MSWIVAIVMRLAGLAGVSLSPFAAGSLFAGGLAVVAGGAAIAGGAHLYNAGFSSAETKCEAAKVAEQNAQLQARLAEKDRQLVFANALQQRDAKRAAAAEAQIQSNQGAIDATPANPTQCFDRAASRRVRGVR